MATSSGSWFHIRDPELGPVLFVMYTTRSRHLPVIFSTALPYSLQQSNRLPVTYRWCREAAPEGSWRDEGRSDSPGLRSLPADHPACSRTRPVLRAASGFQSPEINDTKSLLAFITTISAITFVEQLECGPMANVMVALPNIGGALCSTPQSLADTHYLTAVQ